MQSDKDPRDNAHFFRIGGYNFGWYRHNFIDERTVEPKQGLQFAWKGESDMLISSLWQDVQVFFNPVVSGLFSASRAEAGFAGVETDFGEIAVRALVKMITHEGRATGHDFDNVSDDIFSYVVFKLQEEAPPISIVQKYITKVVSPNHFQAMIS